MNRPAKTHFLLIITLTSSLVINCSQKHKGAIAEFKAVLGEIVQLQEKALAGIEKAKDGKEGAAILDKLREEMLVVKGKAEMLEKKYPETKTSEPPAEIEAELKKGTEVSKKLGEALLQAMEKFANDKDFLEAAKRMRVL